MNDPALDESHAVTIAVAPNEIVAQMWQEVLRDEGIIAALKPSGAGHSFASPATPAAAVTFSNLPLPRFRRRTFSPTAVTKRSVQPSPS